MVEVMAYGPDDYMEQELGDLNIIAPLLDHFPVTWVNVEGLGDAEIIHRIGHLFHLHPLALEDVVNVHQRAKAELYEQQLFVVARMVSLQSSLDTEQISIFIGPNYVVTFQGGRKGDCLSPVRDRIRMCRGRLRNLGPDHLMYAILDAVVDGYFPVLEQYGEQLEELDTELTESHHQNALKPIHGIRGELLLLRRAIWPHREMINALIRDPFPQIADETRLYLRDCYDHSVQIIDLVETYRESAADLRDFYLSMASNRMNEIMKVLTIMSTIFMPLSFIAGIYGMNFEVMPELKWAFGYPMSLIVMATVACGFLVFFFYRGWLQPND